MALTELQLPDKAVFYRNIQTAATKMDQLINQWRELALFVGNVGTADMDAMGIASGQVRTDLVEFRIVLNEMVSLFDGEDVSPTNSPSDVIDKIRSMT